jgi:excisionase family DNA binding protein
MNDDIYPQWIAAELGPNENTVYFYTAAEVAPMFRVSKSTVLTWRRQGILRAIRTPGRGLRFPHTEVRRVKRELNDVP